MLSQIEACSLPLLYKLSVALPAGNQTYPKKDKTNLRIDCGFLLVVISNEVLIVGIADSVCSPSDISSRELNAWLGFTSMWVIFTYLTLECTVWGPAFLIGINQYVYSYTTKETSMVTSWINSQSKQEFCAVCEEQTFRYLKEAILCEHQWFINRVVDYCQISQPEYWDEFWMGSILQNGMLSESTCSLANCYHCWNCILSVEPPGKWNRKIIKH